MHKAYNISSNSNGLYGKSIMIVICLCVLISCTPKFGSSSLFVFIGLAFIFIYNIYLFKIPKRKKIVLSSPIDLIIGYIILNIFYRLLGISDSSWGNTMNEIVFLFCFPLAAVAMNKLKAKQIKILFFIIVGIILVNIIENIIISILFPQINEYSSEYLDDAFLKSINAGGSNFYNMTFFFTMICFFIFQNCKEKRLKKIMFCSFVIGSIYIIGFCNKGSVVVFLILSIILLYVVKRVEKPQKALFTLFLLMFFIYFVCILFQNEIITMISEIVPSERLRVRLITLIDPDNALANKDTVTGRQNLYLLSIETWLSGFSNLIFGIGDIRTSNNPEVTGIGQHADLLDTFARYGIIGGGLLISILIKSFKVMKRKLFMDYGSQFQIIFILFIIFGCTKSILVPAIGVMVFLFLPFSKILLQEDNVRL